MTTTYRPHLPKQKLGALRGNGLYLDHSANVVFDEFEHLIAAMVHDHSSHRQCESARFLIGCFWRGGHGVWIGSHVQQSGSGMCKRTLDCAGDVCLSLYTFRVETNGFRDGAEIRVVHFGSPEGVTANHLFQPDHSERGIVEDDDLDRQFLGDDGEK